MSEGDAQERRGGEEEECELQIVFLNQCWTHLFQDEVR